MSFWCPWFCQHTFDLALDLVWFSPWFLKLRDSDTAWGSDGATEKEHRTAPWRSCWKSHWEGDQRSIRPYGPSMAWWVIFVHTSLMYHCVRTMPDETGIAGSRHRSPTPSGGLKRWVDAWVSSWGQSLLPWIWLNLNIATLPIDATQYQSPGILWSSYRFATYTACRTVHGAKLRQETADINHIADHQEWPCTSTGVCRMVQLISCHRRLELRFAQALLNLKYSLQGTPSSCCFVFSCVFIRLCQDLIFLLERLFWDFWG